MKRVQRRGPARWAAGAVRRLEAAADPLRSRFVPQSQDQLIRDSASYWTGQDPTLAANAHWQQNGSFDAAVWAGVGSTHLGMIEQLLRHEGHDGFPERVLEWGCGGGANAVVLAPRSADFIGVDVSQQTLKECVRQVSAVGSSMRPVLVDVASPEQAIEAVGAGQVDLFVCTYVVELLPSQQYAERLLRIARDLLRPGGLALIQVKYQTHDRSTRSWRSGYRRHLASMTTFPIEDFWQLCDASGVHPRFVTLVPQDALDSNYAYFFLKR